MGKMRYRNMTAFTYHSERYGKKVTVPAGFLSDGATFAVDIDSQAWWVHDRVCDTGKWDDGTRCTNWQASTVLSDILRDDGHWLRALYWWPATFVFGELRKLWRRPKKEKA